MATEKVGVYRKYHGTVPTDKVGIPLPKSEWPPVPCEKGQNKAEKQSLVVMKVAREVIGFKGGNVSSDITICAGPIGERGSFPRRSGDPNVTSGVAVGTDKTRQAGSARVPIETCW